MASRRANRWPLVTEKISAHVSHIIIGQRANLANPRQATRLPQDVTNHAKVRDNGTRELSIRVVGQ